MKHLKRMAAPRTWLIPRKGKMKYAVKPMAKLTSSVTLLMILRDILKLAKNRREAKNILFTNDIFVNAKKRLDEKFPVQIFDTISIPKINKYYKTALKNKKIFVQEINKEEAGKKVCKVIGKKILKSGKIQINCDDGHNFISDQEIKIGDSLLIDLERGKIIKHLPLKEGASVIIITGKHIGKNGNIIKIVQEGKRKIIVIKTPSEEIKADVKNIVVTNEK